jgi:dTDP-glucose pyrophosphorylase
MSQIWKQIAIPADANIRQAMETIDRGAKKIALVIEDACHLSGTITDGDIRRALLKGRQLDDPVEGIMNPNPVTGLLEEDKRIWQRTMQRHSLRHLPILDKHGCVVDLVQYQVPIEPSRTTPVIIMAGGLGSRLRPLTEDLPKPLIPVGPKPVLETIIENFAEQGFENIHLCLNYKGDMICDYFGDGERLGVHIRYIREDRRLGTAGALSLLPEAPAEPIIVMNGDLLTKVDFVRLLEFHNKQEFVATMAVREYSHQIPYGVLRIGDGYRIRQLTEKPIERHYVNAGIYVLSPEAMQLVPEQKFYDMPSLFQRMMDMQRPVGSFPLRDYWIDIGRIEDLERASAEFAEMFE